MTGRDPKESENENGSGSESENGNGSGGESERKSGDESGGEGEKFVVGQKMTRYFGDVLYSGEVYKIVNDTHHIVYEDDDKEEMDHDQLHYAVSLYKAEIV